MIIAYEVPEALRATFEGKTQQEINSIITQALQGTELKLIKNMCFDILSKVSNLDTQAVASPMQRARRPAPVKDVKAQPVKDSKVDSNNKEQSTSGKPATKKRRRRSSSIVK